MSTTPIEKNIPVFIDDENTGRIQIGWATPEVEGVRAIQRFGIFEKLELPNVIFGDAPAEEPVVETKTEKSTR